LPSAAERFDQAEAARAEFAALGYIAIGMDHFALPGDELAVAVRTGRLRRSFQGYVAGGASAIIGLGPSAISTLPQGYAQNVAEVGAWGKLVHAETLPCARGHALTEDDRRRRTLIEQIMCDFSGDLAPLGGRVACARELSALQPLADDGLVSIEGDRLLVPTHARPFCRLVAQTFDAYAGQPTARHSNAV
jgi:oxygen-independent coproporphyrinogen III oxidase